MNHWIVCNSYQGAADVGVLVAAPDQDTAINIASEALRKVAEEPWPWPESKQQQYPRTYWHPNYLRARKIDLPLVGCFEI